MGFKKAKVTFQWAGEEYRVEDASFEIESPKKELINNSYFIISPAVLRIKDVENQRCLAAEIIEIEANAGSGENYKFEVTKNLQASTPRLEGDVYIFRVVSSSK
ncbi:hypothetical protein [Pseudomonas sp. RIT-PI-AD]|uniref:hypothetical protein n=1 Tax=Pseudomonas sp. RIT-PI-AD TaxID=3035294 RepID=UPI0021DAF264|nr:hypothetical protein [Pseudomonas sp. RIT-PI-AD]